MQRFSHSAGIAIGPILFIIAILGVLGMVASSSTGMMGGAATSDRVAADIGTQANLIRSKINECYMQSLAMGIDNSTAPPYEDEPYACEHDSFPCSDQTDGTLVKDLTCPGDPLTGTGNQQNIWTGPRASNLPPSTPGFGEWKYFNGGKTAQSGVKGGERCFWIIPPTGNSQSGLVAGLKRVAMKFSSQETNYLVGSTTQKFVVFITPPINGVLSDDSPCSVP